MEKTMETTAKIDIEKILADIKKEIKEKGYTNDILSFDIPFNDDFASLFSDDFASLFSGTDLFAPVGIRQDIETLYKHWEIVLYKPLKGNPLSIALKRCIRKATKFLLDPIVFEQRYFNAAVTRTIANIARICGNTRKDLEAELDTIREENKKLQERVRALEKERTL
jgi:hypothetical protein